jgi:hypothetical protein
MCQQQGIAPFLQAAAKIGLYYAVGCLLLWPDGNSPAPRDVSDSRDTDFRSYTIKSVDSPETNAEQVSCSL